MAAVPGLNIRQGLTPNLVPYVTFAPTLGIVAARINTLAGKIESYEEPLRKAIRDVIIPSMQTNFAVGGRPPWAPWSAATIEIMERLGGGGDLLVRSGALRETMSQESIWTVNSGLAILASLPPNVWYGNIHQGGFEGTGGGARAKGKSLKSIVARASSQRTTAPIPARPFAVLQPQDEEQIHEIFNEWLGEQINISWPGV